MYIYVYRYMNICIYTYTYTHIYIKVLIFVCGCVYVLVPTCIQGDGDPIDVVEVGGKVLGRNFQRSYIHMRIYTCIFAFVYTG